MKRKTKRVLGVFGLAAVMAMTAIAIALPSPEAHAEEQSNADVTIQVTVVGPGSSLQLVKPTEGEVVKSNIVPVEYTYQNMQSVATNLVCMVAGGQTVEKTFDFEPTDEQGTHAFTIDLNELNIQPDADCRISLAGKSTTGQDVQDAGVKFTYRAVKVDMGDKDNTDGKPNTDENGDPEVSIEIKEGVESILLQVYDMEGNPVFVNKDGVEEPILVTRDQFDLINNVYKLNLPMSKYGAKAGWYDLVVVAYAGDGKEVVSMNTYRFYYGGPVTPNVPGTGTIMDNLNISRVDYVVTGLIAFGSVAAFGVYLVARKSRR